MRWAEPPMGQRLVRHLDMPGMFGQASRARGSSQFRPFRDHGQVEGH